MISIPCSYLFILGLGHKHKHLGLQLHTLKDYQDSVRTKCGDRRAEGLVKTLTLENKAGRDFELKQKFHHNFKVNRIAELSVLTSSLSPSCLFIFSVKINNRTVWEDHGKLIK